MDRVSAVRIDPDPALAATGAKCVLLQPKVKHDDPATWSAVLQRAVEAKELSLTPYDLTLDYDYWNYRTYVESPCAAKQPADSV